MTFLETLILYFNNIGTMDPMCRHDSWILKLEIISELRDERSRDS